MKKELIKAFAVIVAIAMLIPACGAKESGGESGRVGIPNPWSEASSAEEAAKGAGIDSFVIPEGAETGLGPVEPEAYRYMKGLAQADIPIAAVQMTIRKGSDEVAEPGDVSGDYGEYKNEWKKEIDGIEVKCYGNREGEATKTIWKDGDYYFSVVAIGAGGDDDFGLSEKDLEIIVSGTK